MESAGVEGQVRYRRWLSLRLVRHHSPRLPACCWARPGCFRAGIDQCSLERIPLAVHHYAERRQSSADGRADPGVADQRGRRAVQSDYGECLDRDRAAVDPLHDLPAPIYQQLPAIWLEINTGLRFTSP